MHVGQQLPKDSRSSAQIHSSALASSVTGQPAKAFKRRWNICRRGQQGPTSAAVDGTTESSSTLPAPSLLRW
jgi:hypothetical protein